MMLESPGSVWYIYDQRRKKRQVWGRIKRMKGKKGIKQREEQDTLEEAHGDSKKHVRGIRSCEETELNGGY